MDVWMYASNYVLYCIYIPNSYVTAERRAKRRDERREEKKREMNCLYHGFFSSFNPHLLPFTFIYV